MRSQARENAFKIIFETLFHDVDFQLSLENLEPLKKEEDKLFFNQIVENFQSNKASLQQEIEENLKNFSYSRLFKIDLALVFLALTEIEYCQTPKAVAINEVLELAKKYSTAKSSKFINGLVCAIIDKN